MKTLTMIAAVALLSSPREMKAQDQYTVGGGKMSVVITRNGEITGIQCDRGHWRKHVRASTQLEGCSQVGDATARRTPGGGIRFTRRAAGPGGEGELTVVDIFTPDSASVRWDV
ncbi:MAG TPA: hypothetical protein VEO56_03545, partial [Bacteroidota bacterium]|nr:hypothetical protein [Bacteroidota bacterium]